MGNLLTLESLLCVSLQAGAVPGLVKCEVYNETVFLVASILYVAEDC